MVLLVGVERCRELREVQNADSFITKLPYYRPQLLHSQHLVSPLESCTLSFLQYTLSIMQGTTFLSAHTMLRVLSVNEFAEVTLVCEDGQ